MIIITNPETRINVVELKKMLADEGLDTRIEIASHDERRHWTSRTETKEDLSWQEKLALYPELVSK